MCEGRLQCAPFPVIPLMRPGGIGDSMMKIGTIELRNNVLLAPMAGFTDYPMRRMVWGFGGGMTVSEMVASRPDLWHTTKSTQRRTSGSDAGPNVVQLAGSDPQMLADAAWRQYDQGAEIIDINFGCPAKKVCNKAAGSALLGDPELVARIIDSVANAVPIPVTAKIRTGLTPDARNGCTIARAAEAAGARSLVVHGRTRACRFMGQAEHETVAGIRRSVRIPVIANGDIDSVATMQAVLAATGVDGVMIGRAAVGAPWLPGVLAGRPMPDRATRLHAMLEHVDLIHGFYAAEEGFRIARKHVLAYFRNLGLDHFTQAFHALPDAGAQRCFLDELVEREIAA
jgi:tRNA-dihydrouridine synthase B